MARPEPETKNWNQGGSDLGGKMQGQEETGSHIKGSAPTLSFCRVRPEQTAVMEGQRSKGFERDRRGWTYRRGWRYKMD